MYFDLYKLYPIINLIRPHISHIVSFLKKENKNAKFQRSIFVEFSIFLIS